MNDRDDRDELLQSYLRFANDINRNISNMIHLTNNLRYNTSQIFNHRLNTHFMSNDIFFPPIPPPPLSSVSPSRARRRRRPRLRRTVTRRYANLPTAPLFPTRAQLTETQINNATESFLFADISTNNLICPITRQNFEPTSRILRIRHCKHIFCENSLRQWFQTSSECPVCRYDIRGNNRTISSIINQILQHVPQDISANIFSNDISGNAQHIEYSVLLEERPP